MTTHPATGTTTATTVRRPRPLSPLNHAGLVVLALLALSDVVGVVLIDPPAPGAAENGPPAEVLAFALAMGVLTLAGVVLAWVGRWRTAAIRFAAVTRILSALTAVPAFFVGGVPPVLLASAAVAVLGTVVGVVLVLVRPRRRA
jgi:hypothetical protein